MNQDRVNALLCAIAVLDGTSGGYSPHEKYNAKLLLMDMLAEEEKKGTGQNVP